LAPAATDGAVSARRGLLAKGVAPAATDGVESARRGLLAKWATAAKGPAAARRATAAKGTAAARSRAATASATTGGEESDELKPAGEGGDAISRDWTRQAPDERPDLVPELRSASRRRRRCARGAARGSDERTHAASLFFLLNGAKLKRQTEGGH
jgi:hypothetical protein